MIQPGGRRSQERFLAWWVTRPCWGIPLRASAPGRDAAGGVEMRLWSVDGEGGQSQARVEYEVDSVAATTIRKGVFLHPRHNWFVSAAMTEDDVSRALEATEAGFQAVEKLRGS